MSDEAGANGKGKSAGRLGGGHLAQLLADTVSDAIGSRQRSVADLSALRRRTRLNRRLPKDAVLGGDAEKRLLLLERRNGRDDILPFAMLAQGAATGRAVCKIERGDGSTGTGFLVSEDVLLTNHHVLPSSEAALDATCTFDYELDHATRALKSTHTFRLKPAELFITSEAVETGGLDYTFLRIDSAAGRAFGHIALSRGSTKLDRGEAANLIHHPDGEPKAVTIQDNRLVEDRGLLLGYLSDADLGSSGAPVFNNRWEAVGLHFGAERLEGVQDMRGHPADYLNLAVRMSAIAADLERRAHDEVDTCDATAALATFRDTDTLLGGYFGALGRTPEGTRALDKVSSLYSKRRDIDVGFLDTSRVAADGSPRLSSFVKLLAELGLDIYVLEGCAKELAPLITEHLEGFGFVFKIEMQNLDAPHTGTVVLWNARTVHMVPLEAEWTAASRSDFRAVGGTPGLEGIAGPLFDRLPRRFRFRAFNDENAPEIDLVSFSFERDDATSARRQMATRVLAVALGRVVAADPDWAARTGAVVVGGRFDAAAAGATLSARQPRDMGVMAARTPDGDSIVSLLPPRSAVARLWLPPGLAPLPGGVVIASPAPARPPAASLPGNEYFRPLCLRLSYPLAGVIEVVGGGLSEETRTEFQA